MGTKLVNGGLYLSYAVLGTVLGIVGAFSFERSVLVAVGICLVDLVVFRTLGWAAGTRLGAIVPSVFWAVTMFVLSTARPEGDVIVPATTSGYIFIFGGMAAAIAATYLTPASRSWMTGLPHDTPTAAR
ncbi:MAG: DUF6113 family protein [Streptosporangiaceae bacterium]